MQCLVITAACSLLTSSHRHELPWSPWESYVKTRISHTVEVGYQEEIIFPFALPPFLYLHGFNLRTDEQKLLMI